VVIAESVPSRPLPAEASSGAARAAFTGAAIAFPLVFAAVTALVLVGGGNVLMALGVALFVSFWAGPAFGGLFGAVMYLERMSDDDDVAQSSRSPR